MENSVETREFGEWVSSSKIKTYSQLARTMDLDWAKNKDYRVIKTAEKLKECIPHMLRAPLLGVDTEATGLGFYNMSKDNPNRDILVGICISWKRDQGIYIPLAHTKFENIDKTFVLKVLAPILETKPCATTNGIFDGKVFYSEGILLNIKHDTIQILFNIDTDEFRFSRGLKNTVKYMYGYTPVEFSDIFEYEKDYHLFRYVDEDVARIYACADCDHTLSLTLDLLPKLQPIHRRGYIRDMEIMPHLMRSEYEGKSVDFNLLKILSDINKADLEMVQDFIYKYVGATLAQKINGAYSNEMYRFNINSVPELRKILVDKLQYPEKEGHGIDKAVLKYWSTYTAKTPSKLAKELMPTDLMSVSVNYPEILNNNSSAVLLKASAFHNCEYRISLLIQLYRRLAKNQSSFFDVLLANTTDLKYFTGIKMSRAATFRIIDNVQTLDGNLKALIAPPSDFYQIGYDYCQIEARVMIGLSGHKEYILMLEDPESDYHTISTAIIEKIPPYKVSKQLRSVYKPVNFGIPYAMGPQNMMEQRLGIGLSKEEAKVALEETKETIAKWKVGMAPVWNMLERYRAKACVPLADSEKPFYMRDLEVGRVTSPYGRSRYFDLTDLTDSKKASIHRKAGNFPIQCFARDIFMEGVVNLGDFLIKEGLMDIKVPDDYSAIGYHFENKVIFMAYIHDEVQLCIHKSIGVKWMLKQIYNNCVVRIDGHPSYYIGASIVNNWAESKEGDHEVPVQWLIDLPDDLPKFEAYRESIQHEIDIEASLYIKERTRQDFEKIGVHIQDALEITVADIDAFESYYLRNKMKDYYPPLPDRVIDKNCNYDDYFISSLENAFGHSIKVKDKKIVQEEVSITPDTTEYTFDWSQFWNIFGEDETDDDYYDGIVSELSLNGVENPSSEKELLQTNLYALENLLTGG